MSGNGQSSALVELGELGFRVIDTDEPGWTEWSDSEAGFVWREDRIVDLLACEVGPCLYVSGTVSNQGRFYPRLTRSSSTRSWRAIGPMRSTELPAVTPRGGISDAPPNGWVPPSLPDAMVSVTDPDSRHIKSNEAYVQGYNAQAVVDQNQIVLAAEITNSTVDFSQLDPMITAALGELAAAGVTGRLEVAVADAQYWKSSTWTR